MPKERISSAIRNSINTKSINQKFHDRGGKKIVVGMMFM